MLSQGAAISPRGSFSIINSLTRFLCSHQAVESVCHNCSVIRIVSRVLIRSLHVVSLTYPLLSCDLGRVLLFLLGGFPGLGAQRGQNYFLVMLWSGWWSLPHTWIFFIFHCIPIGNSVLELTRFLGHVGWCQGLLTV